MKVITHMSLIKKISIGVVLGTVLGLAAPTWTAIGILGNLFIGGLKAIAPLLVFLLIIDSLGKHQHGNKTHLKTVIVLYLLATFVAALAAVFASYLFPVALALPNPVTGHDAPSNIQDILTGILMNAVMNPIEAVTTGNYLAILMWGCLLGISLRVCSETTKQFFSDVSGMVTHVVQLVIELAPVGITGLVFSSVAEIGLDGLVSYGRLILLVVGTMLFVSFIVYPLMIFLLIRQNPFPLTFWCMKESGIPAFFTRSSAVNIPINMALAKELGLDKESYAISIPLGATANSGGAAITISIMTLAAAQTLEIATPFFLAFLLCLLAAISSTGVSGIAGGSLLLIPLACSLFNISNDIAMQVVAIGFIIGVIQDSVETAVNSASDLLFTAAAEFYDLKREGVSVNITERVKNAKQLRP